MTLHVPFTNTEVEIDKRKLVIGAITGALILGGAAAAISTGLHYVGAGFGFSQILFTGVCTISAAIFGAGVGGGAQFAHVPLEVARDAKDMCVGKACEIADKFLPEAKKKPAEKKAQKKSVEKPVVNTARGEHEETSGRNIIYHFHAPVNTFNATEDLRERATARQPSARGKSPSRTRSGKHY